MSRVVTAKTRRIIERAELLQRLDAKKHARIFVKLHEEDSRALRDSASSIPAATYEDHSPRNYEITILNKLPMRESHAEDLHTLLEQLAVETEAFKVDLYPPTLQRHAKSGVWGIGCSIESEKLTHLRRKLLTGFYKLYGITKKEELPKGLSGFYRPHIMLKEDIQQQGAQMHLEKLKRSRLLPSRPLLVGLGTETHNTRRAESGSEMIFHAFPWDWNKKNIRRAMKRGGLLPQDQDETA